MAETFYGKVEIAEETKRGPRGIPGVHKPRIIIDPAKTGGFVQARILDLRSKQAILLNGTMHSIDVCEDSGKPVISLDTKEGPARITVGAGGSGGKPGVFIVRDNTGKDSILLDGAKGDIVLGNADCAEDFDISDTLDIEPGTVVVLNEKGKLQANSKPYDKKVAGVISGAGDSKPGIVLDKKHSRNNRKPVGLMGKVYCKVDADSSPIEVGDMLTTSSTPGHAMKAEDPFRAFGAVIGKALQSIKSGKGLISILISLQ